MSGASCAAATGLWRRRHHKIFKLQGSQLMYELNEKEEIKKSCD